MKLIIQSMAFFSADNKFVGVKRLYYICDAHYYEMRRHIFLEKRFRALSFTGNRQFQNNED